ncbi:MAG: oligoribonuclease [Chloroflexi bacterium]|nr:oligoribonuclease [Chloroflexota bacterium]
MSAVEQKDRLVWIDLEMTGLDPRTCVIVEIAVVITELSDLTPLDRYHAVIHQPEPAIAAADPVVQKMHARSGLWDRIRSSTIALGDAERSALEMVSRWCEPQRGILAGNSVWQDRRFLSAYMPRFESYLHYRQVDVSTLKVLAGAWYGSDAVPTKADTHTALSDVGESIAELEHYRRTIFKVA